MTTACLAGVAVLAVVGAIVAGSPSSRRAASPAGQVTRGRWGPGDADRVVRTLRAAGLPIRVTTAFTPANDPDHLLGAPGGCVSKVAFVDPRIDGGAVPDPDPGSVSIGGIVEVYPDAAAAGRRATALTRAAQGVPALAERDYLAGPALIRLSIYLHRRQARQYQRALHAVRVASPTPTPQVITA